MLADGVDGEGDARNREHGGHDAVGRHGGSPGVSGRKVHGHLVDGNRANQAQVNLIRHIPLIHSHHNNSTVSVNYSETNSGTHAQKERGTETRTEGM